MNKILQILLIFVILSNSTLKRNRLLELQTPRALAILTSTDVCVSKACIAALQSMLSYVVESHLVNLSNPVILSTTYPWQKATGISFSS
jgi:hypothetical protein